MGGAGNYRIKMGGWGLGCVGGARKMQDYLKSKIVSKIPSPLSSSNLKA